MTRIRLHPPEVTARTARFRWTVEPASALYRATSFALRFPDGVDVTRVPEHAWWVVALGCLHLHWPLLRPCRVELPVTLGPGEAETWLRQTDAAVATLEFLRGTADVERTIELVERGPRVGASALPDRGGCATAFSGGKDSLLQVGLLRELTREPLLVTVTSPMPDSHDHETDRRRAVLREIAGRGPLTHVHVDSDLRACWSNGYANQQGYDIAVNELTDTLLYFGATLVVAAALGVTHVFLASEAQVQENAEHAGRVVQHAHFMYSTITQRVLQALLRPTGIRYGSLTSPLHSFQVQHLLWTRYRDLGDLQYSCWRVGPGEAMCSRCPQCLRIGLTAIELGIDPAPLGLHLRRVLWSHRYWRRRERTGPLSPNDAVGVALEGQTNRSLRTIPLRRMAHALFRTDGGGITEAESWRALYAYARLRLRCVDDGPAPGFRAGFLAMVDPLLRERVAAIFHEHFQPEPPAAYAGVLERNDRLARWITAPLGGEA